MPPNPRNPVARKQVGNYAGAVACNQAGIGADLVYCRLRGHET